MGISYNCNRIGASTLGNHSSDLTIKRQVTSQAEAETIGMPDTECLSIMFPFKLWYNDI